MWQEAKGACGLVFPEKLEGVHGAWENGEGLRWLVLQMVGEAHGDT